ncbi:MAG: trypsin-like peptidase domain-containing protein [Xenococcaceae cyanobacterium]
MEYHDTEELVRILAAKATVAPIGPQAFFRNLVLRANLPQHFTMEIIGAWTGNPDADARTLVKWADNMGGNPQDPRLTVLGSLLQPLIQNVGLDTASLIIALIIRYNLYRDLTLLEELPIKCEIPLSTSPAQTSIVPIGPDFNWQGPTDKQKLQALWQQRRVTSLDVAFIHRGIQQSASVCRIEVPDPNRPGKKRAIGTGFLLRQNLLLTNYHVLAPYPDADLTAYVSEIELHFGYLTSPEGNELQGQTFKLTTDPIRHSSPTKKYDYVLLQIEDSIKSANNTYYPVKTHYDKLPEKEMGINLLQHPEGQTMKIALSTNGITGVYERNGRIQYFSDTSGGSSGSPCFNDDWKVIALHHAQKAGTFGVYCEGILYSVIHEEIANELENF